MGRRCYQPACVHVQRRSSIGAATFPSPPGFTPLALLGRRAPASALFHALPQVPALDLHVEAYGAGNRLSPEPGDAVAPEQEKITRHQAPCRAPTTRPPGWWRTACRRVCPARNPPPRPNPLPVG